MLISFQVELRGVSKRDYTKKDGSTGSAYNVHVESLNDFKNYEFSCRDVIYKAFQKGDLKRGDSVLFYADYRPEYQWNQVIVESYKL